MDENITSHDVDEKQEVNKQNQPEETPRFLTIWDKFWKRVQKIGLNDFVSKFSTVLLTIVMVGLVIWVMKTFFLKEEQAQTAAGGLYVSTEVVDSSELVLPAYEGVAPVEGISRSSDISTDVHETASSRYDVVKYEVVAGDTLIGIADKFGLEPETILWCNYDVLLDNPAAIYPGQVLDIYPADGTTYRWQEGDGLNGVATGLHVTPADIIEWPGNNLSYETIGDYAYPNIAVGTLIFAPGGSRSYYDWSAALFNRDDPATSRILGPGHCEAVYSGPIGSEAFVWPTSETFISGYEFSPEVNHWGIDIGGDLGNPIYAADAGVVVYAGWNDWGYGNVIVLDHGNGWQTLYAHLSEVYVNCGDYVNFGGQLIGAMGSTGNSSGPHLHYEMSYNGSRVNPHRYYPY
ncbi:MAG: peptidoglycan DD-metalloendopeptidase family protein [Chloroflexi bacterium]|jgi:LysM repeat protein|nr:peptidoglycan DD-metalloendopeptidase family protein [Chloroflexota bacterium]